MRGIIAAIITLAWMGAWAPPASAAMEDTLDGAAVAPMEQASDRPESWRGVVMRVVSDTERTAPTGARVRAQELEVELREGPRRGERVTIAYELTPLAIGDRVFVAHLVGADGEDIFALEDVDRRAALAVVVAAFVLAVIILGRGQGARALATLAVSIVLLTTVLLPLLARGYPPAWTAAAYAVVVLALALPLTHGFRRTTVAALLGTTVAILLTVLLASLAVAATNLTGLAEETTLYLDIAYGGRLDLRGLLLGAIIVGVLGVLDDVAVTQAAAVEELRAANPNMSRREVVRRALRIGREHVGALVNTLALAYIGAALPLLLLLADAPVPLTRMLNREIFASEIVRTAIGSIGLIATVPLTTWAAAFLVHPESTAGTSWNPHH